jgi:hypothetical protein
MESHATITDDTFRALNEQLDHRELVELLLVISVYCAVARFLNSTRIQIENDNPLAGESSPTGRHLRDTGRRTGSLVGVPEMHLGTASGSQAA